MKRRTVQIVALVAGAAVLIAAASVSASGSGPNAQTGLEPPPGAVQTPSPAPLSSPEIRSDPGKFLPLFAPGQVTDFAPGQEPRADSNSGQNDVPCPNQQPCGEP